MKGFWRGFAKHSTQIQFKKHVILLFWEPEGRGSSEVKDETRRLSIRYPTVKVRLINVLKDPERPGKHNVRQFPTVLLLKDGREVDRIGGPNKILLEQFFRRAHV